MLHTIKLGLFTCLVYITSTLQPSMALSTDKDQPADISADRITFDMKTGYRVYLRDVLITQGTLNIKADKLIAKYKDGKLETATAWGNMAKFRQRPDGKDNDVFGSAKKMILNETENTLTLIDNASLKQAGNTAKGKKIIYNMATHRLQVIGSAGIKTKGDNGNKTSENPKRVDPFANFDDEMATPEQPVKEKSAQQQQETESGRSRMIIQPKS